MVTTSHGHHVAQGRASLVHPLMWVTAGPFVVYVIQDLITHLVG